MKASEDARAVAGEAGILGVHGGAFSVGSDDADVWGGLTGEEVGEAYGVGGLGLIGTGRGGGGVGSGYGRGHGVGFGEAGSTRSGRFEPAGSFDKTVQARVLTAGVVDDNADADGYTEAMTRLAGARGSIGLTDAMINMTAPSYRHTTRPRALDVALVIDTTGSMGDGFEYLKVEPARSRGRSPRRTPACRSAGGWSRTVITATRTSPTPRTSATSTPSSSGSGVSRPAAAATTPRPWTRRPWRARS